MSLLGKREKLPPYMWQRILQKVYKYSLVCEMYLGPHICDMTQKMKNYLTIQMAQEIE